MELALIGISILCIVLILYVAGIRFELRSIRRQLEKRKKEQAQSPVLLELRDKNLNGLTVALNETLKQEADLRISCEIQEREFKDLITNISHDLRTPLTVIKGYLQLLKRCEMDEKAKEYLQICSRHTDELEQRTHQFFEYSYWLGYEEPVLLNMVNVTGLVIDTMTDFVPVFEEKGISMRLEEENIKKAMGDHELIKRIMENLLKNCLQYATGEVTVSIREEDRMEDKGRLWVMVSNPVAGDCMLDADRVFQRFYVGNAARNQSTGLGLSVVKLLVEKMGGEVFAKREGDMFCIGFCLCI